MNGKEKKVDEYDCNVMCTFSVGCDFSSLIVPLHLASYHIRHFSLRSEGRFSLSCLWTKILFSLSYYWKYQYCVAFSWILCLETSCPFIFKLLIRYIIHYTNLKMVDNICSLQFLTERDSPSLISFWGIWLWMMTVMNWVAPVPASDFFFF